jgi:hypothetical protein
MSRSACPRIQLLDHLPADQSAIDTLKLVRPRTSFTFLDGKESQGHVQEPQEMNFENDDEDGRHPQREMGKDAAAALLSKKVDGTRLWSEKDESLAQADSGPDSQPSQDESASHSDDYSDGELDSPESDDEDREPRPATRKRRRTSSYSNGPTQKKQKHNTYGDVAEDFESARVESTADLNPATKAYGYHYESEQGEDVNEGTEDEGDSWSEDELTNNKFGSKIASKRPRLTKQKQSSSFHNNPMSKKRKYRSQLDTRHKRGADPKSPHRSAKSQPPFNQSLRPPASDIVAQLPSPAHSASRTIDTEFGIRL